MGAIALTRDDGRRLALFTKTVGKDLVGEEIDVALEYCRIFNANPLTRDIYFFAFGKHGTDKRQVVPVISVGHYRKIAARSGNYRPDEKAPRITYDESLVSPLNPKGILDCEVTVWRHAHGAWHPITERLKWEERAPIKDVWEDGKPTGKQQLDPRKPNWRTMPETMLAKCVEVAAIRKGWPEETSGSYSHEEMDSFKTLDLTATEIVKAHEAEDRLAKIGGANRLLIDWLGGGPLSTVEVGKLGDEALKWIAEHKDEPSTVLAWRDRNRHSLQEFWARDKDAALAVKAAVEKVETSMNAMAAE